MNVESQDKQNSSEELIKRMNIPGTPFWLFVDNTGDKERRYIVMGRYKIADLQEEESAEQYLDENMWQVMMHVAIIVREQAKEIEKTATEIKEIPQG